MNLTALEAPLQLTIILRLMIGPCERTCNSVTTQESLEKQEHWLFDQRTPLVYMQNPKQEVVGHSCSPAKQAGSGGECMRVQSDVTSLHPQK